MHLVRSFGGQGPVYTVLQILKIHFCEFTHEWSGGTIHHNLVYNKLTHVVEF